MNERECWNNFVKSGKISDYISYCNSKNTNEKEIKNAPEHEGTHTQRTEYR